MFLAKVTEQSRVLSTLLVVKLTLQFNFIRITWLTMAVQRLHLCRRQTDVSEKLSPPMCLHYDSGYKA